MNILLDAIYAALIAVGTVLAIFLAINLGVGLLLSLGLEQIELIVFP